MMVLSKFRYSCESVCLSITVRLDQDLGSSAPNGATAQTYTLSNLSLETGDVVTVTGHRNLSEYARH